MIDIIPLSPGITLRACRDDRFKQGCLTVQLVRPMRREEAALNALLPAVLLRGTRGCPDMRAVTHRLDALYGASVSTLVRRIGDYHTTGLYCGFMDDRFALPGDRVLEPMVAFLEELLLDSPLEDGGFLPDFVEGERQNLIATIDSELNDKRVYAMNQLLRSLCAGDSFSVSRLGDREAVAAVAPRQLREHYEKALRESPIHIFYVGSAPGERVAELLKPLVARLDRGDILTLPPQTPLNPGQPRDLTQTMDVNQGKLCLGFVTPVTNRSPAFAAMQMLSTLYGSGMTSKLFQNVREKLSLCYSIGASYYGSKGILTVSAGIDFDKEIQTREEILRQLELCRRGEFTQAEITAARESLLSALRATHDSPASIEGYYATAALSGLNMDTLEYAEKIRAVTPEDIARAAASLELHTSFFLKGGSQ